MFLLCLMSNHVFKALLQDEGRNSCRKNGGFIRDRRAMVTLRAGSSVQSSLGPEVGWVGSGADDSHEMAQLVVDFTRVGDGVRDFSPQQVPITPFETIHVRLERALRHPQQPRGLGVGQLALLTGEKLLQVCKTIGLALRGVLVP